MKITNTFKLMAGFVAVLSIFFLPSCIPTLPVGGNPTPTDTTVVYTEFSDSLICPDDDNTLQVDLDADGVSDIHLSWFTNVGQAVCKIWPLTPCTILFHDVSFPFSQFLNANETIDGTVGLGVKKDDGTVVDNLEEFFPIGANSYAVGTVSTNNKLLGFTLTKGDGVHYGWMNVSITATYTVAVGGPSYAKFQINSMAYKKAPNTVILAGKH